MGSHRQRNVSRLVLALTMILSVNAQNSSKAVREEVKVGVVLNMESNLAKISLSCLNMAISDFYDSHHHRSYKTRLALRVMDSNRDVVEAASSGSLSHLSPYTYVFEL